MVVTADSALQYLIQIGKASDGTVGASDYVGRLSHTYWLHPGLAGEKKDVAQDIVPKGVIREGC